MRNKVRYTIDGRKFVDLVPTDGHKSFYGKAQVTTDRDGSRYLWSYDTLVCSVDCNGGVHKHWSGWSATTARHIKSFVGRSISKKEWLNMPYEYAAYCG